MPAFIHATCRCGKRIGWTGTMLDRPRCPKCGYRPPEAELQKAEQQFQADLALLDRRRLSAGEKPED